MQGVMSLSSEWRLSILLPSIEGGTIKAQPPRFFDLARLSAATIAGGDNG